MAKIFVAGHKGMVGSAIEKKLSKKNDIFTIDKKKLDLTNYDQTLNFFKKNKFDYVYICAAKVGGIYSNLKYSADFIYQNLQIQNNCIISSYKTNVKRILFLGSSCIYPKKAKIPIKEDYLLTGSLEKTNEAYAISKIAGLKLCSILHEDYKRDVVCLMPTNVYGLNDNFDIKSSHVIPGLISKFINAKDQGKDVQIWGSGKPIREFIHVDDLASAILVSLKTSKKKLNSIFKKSLPFMNVGSGDHISIKKLAIEIKKLINFEGRIIYDRSYPDGTINKNLDSSLIRKLKWKTKIKFLSGLKKVVHEKQKQINIHKL